MSDAYTSNLTLAKPKDAPVDSSAWATYRQALRDVPTQTGFPWDIEWPEQPK